MNDSKPPSIVDRVIRFCLEQKLVVLLLVLSIVAGGVLVAPFDWPLPWLPRHPVASDAIPNLGENQQIVYTSWPGRTPKDVEDQVTYPLTVALLGIPDVKTVRSSSMPGFSTIYLIFKEGVDFEAAQNRIIARLNGMPANVLPEGVKPTLGPFATGLGQIFWYTLEGRDQEGRPAGGWDLQELRAIQDATVRYSLQAAEGITEVASVGGFVQEYQVDVDPGVLRENGIALDDIVQAVRRSNRDTSARQMEINRVDYLIRTRGYVRSLEDLENAVVKMENNTPLTLRQVAHITTGPAWREGALDKDGVEAVGGVVVVREGFNPLEAIQNVKERIRTMAPSLPAKVILEPSMADPGFLRSFATQEGFEAFKDDRLHQEAWLQWLQSHPKQRWPKGISISRVTVVPFYDRTGLIKETLGTLNSALYEQVLITMLVVILMASQVGVSLMISAVMPLAVFMAFLAMKFFNVDANIVSLSGIAIAIGTIVDMGIIMSQNILQHLADAGPEEKRLEVIYRASSEVGGAILTAIATTVVGFLPVFAMTGAEGRLFLPLAFTKTFCLIGSVVVGITVIPAVAHLMWADRKYSPLACRLMGAMLIAAGILLGWSLGWWAAGLALVMAGIYGVLRPLIPAVALPSITKVLNIMAVAYVGILLTRHWMPLGPGQGLLRNLVLVFLLIGGFQLIYYLLERWYGDILQWGLEHKKSILATPVALALLGYFVWLGFPSLFSFLPRALEKIGLPASTVTSSKGWNFLARHVPGFGKEFMPALDEGSFLYMPTTMPHASMGEALDIVSKQDRALRAIPEIELVVGKIGRAETALDPAPINMIETVINYKNEFITDESGHPILFAYDRATGEYVREDGQLIPAPRGRPYRQWREHIRSPDDIWKEIVQAAELPGSTSAPQLQPIAARLVMLQSGMRAPMGVKIMGHDLESIERAAMLIEARVKEVPGVAADTVVADRILGKPYVEIELQRPQLARFGLRVDDVQEQLDVAVGGMTLTTTVEGRQRYPVRVRAMRELRDHPEALENLLIDTPSGAPVPLRQVAEFRFVRGPEIIKSEDTFHVGYVLFDKQPGYAEVDVVEACRSYLDASRENGKLILPAGISYMFAGTYENQVHAQRTLSVILPLTLLIIFLLIYFQFRSVVTTGLIFSTLLVCWGGGLLFIWLYGRPWFMDFTMFGVSWRELFHAHTVNMSIAIWVGFLALFGIASDDAVVMCTYLDQRFRQTRPKTVDEIRAATVYAGRRRVTSCMMTTATTVLAMLPILTSSGRGADIMIPMSLPVFGGMLLEVITMFLAPVLYCAIQERRVTASTLARHALS